MKVLIDKIKSFHLNIDQKFLGVAILFLWLKSYIVSRFIFDLPLENAIEEFILLINPISSVLILFIGALVIRRKLSRQGIFVLSLLFTFLLYANLVYYRFFNDFITIPVLFQVQNFGDLGGSAKGLMNPWDLLLFVDLFILSFFGRKKGIKSIVVPKLARRFLVVAAAALLVFNVMLAETQRPQLLTRTFDREMLVKYLGVYNYHAYDLFMHSKASAQRAFAESSDIIEVENYVSDGFDEENEFTGIAKDKNVILISMESLQDFVINYEVEGQEVTPFLNQLVKESFYFTNFYQQTGQGKTSDSEFLVDNSLYPLSRGAVFTTNAQNTYKGLPAILNENGYATASFHGNNKSFWNRDLMYKNLGYEFFYDETYFEVSEENSVNYGLKDIPFFEQSIPKLQNLKQPFHAKFITLTNHYPFVLDEEDIMIPTLQTSSGTVNRYVQTVRYFDEALKLFFEQLKETGLYDNSIIILYGDHYGISENHNRAMESVIGKKVTPFEYLKLQKVPFIVHIPGMDGKEMTTVGGQIDVKPTILNLLGIKPGKDIQFGEDLFNENRRDFAVLRDGSFVADYYSYTEGICYQNWDGNPTEDKYCSQLKDLADHELRLSDKVIQGDLIRFLDEFEE
ncbi:LTA synthase family protein [Calidifontibacillus oryziterrae]|uniref:LTA synthase family protein n=1 Tax=Calidifontibacillus oryziterrae TaxID=1191699 RepID=UPI000301D7C0|nr:LTA synthase family protein [Calidifontibacillus oryziterrae]